MQDKNQKSKTLAAVVSGVSGSKTVRADINYKVKHPLYGKYIKKRIRLMVHDEHEAAQVGDKIEVTQSRRYSKSKSWRLVRVIEKSINRPVGNVGRTGNSD